MKKAPLVEVEWVDSAFHRGWSTAEAKRREMTVSRCRTVGYLVSRDKVAIRLTMSTADHEDSYADGIVIPASAITRVRRLDSGRRKA